MTPIDPDNQPREAHERMLGGLEQLAGELDARAYPGQAWLAVPISRRGRWVWKVAGSIAGLAAMVVVAFHYWKASPPGIAPVPGRPNQVVQKPARAPSHGQAADETGLPRIVIVEDMDSYTIIDLNNDMPLVSFASKDSPSLDDLTPILVDTAVDPGS